MKGQFFVIAAIVIAISLFMIKGMIGIYPASEASANENTKLADRQIGNINSEFQSSTGMALLWNDANLSLKQYLSDFSDYIRNSENSKILWIAILTNGTDQNYYVTAGNYLQSDIALIINGTTSTPSGTEMFITDKFTSSKTFTSSINGTINMTISYILEGSAVQDIIQFPVSTKDSATLYLDLSLVSKNSKTRAKDVYTAIKQ